MAKLTGFPNEPGGFEAQLTTTRKHVNVKGKGGPGFVIPVADDTVADDTAAGAPPLPPRRPSS